MSGVRKRPKCQAPLIVKGGKSGELKAVAKSLLTSRIEHTHVCPICGYKEKVKRLSRNKK